MSAVHATVTLLVSVLFWKDARDVLPDDSETVIVAFADGETAHGYYDSADGVWRSLEAARFYDEVEFWAQCPEPPRRDAHSLGAGDGPPRSAKVTGLRRGKEGSAPAREWWVYSTALSEGWLMLHCELTGATGTVRDPSREEWKAAFYAPSKPYRWHDESRVIVDAQEQTEGGK